MNHSLKGNNRFFETIIVPEYKLAAFTLQKLNRIDEAMNPNKAKKPVMVNATEIDKEIPFSSQILEKN